MNNANAQAFPRAESEDRTYDDMPDGNLYIPHVDGMTIRQYAAIHIMAGLAADPNVESGSNAAAGAVKWADALLAELESTKP